MCGGQTDVHTTHSYDPLLPPAQLAKSEAGDSVSGRQLERTHTYSSATE